MRINIPDSLVAERDRVIRIENGIVDKLSAIPGVTAAGFASEMPMEGYPSGWDEIHAEGHTYPPGEIPPLFFFKYVSPGFFHAARTRLMVGRELTWTEVYSRSRVALLSENLARELWGSPAAAVGKHIRELPNDPWSEVVGVVQNVREKGVDQNPPETVYWPLDNPYIGVIRTVTFLIRSDRAGTESFLNEVRQAVWSVNANLPVASPRTMQVVYDESLTRTSFTLVMLAIAGSMALLAGDYRDLRRDLLCRVAAAPRNRDSSGPRRQGRGAARHVRPPRVAASRDRRDDWDGGVRGSDGADEVAAVRDQSPRPVDLRSGADGVGCGHGISQLFACAAGGGGGSGRDAASGVGLDQTENLSQANAAAPEYHRDRKGIHIAGESPTLTLERARCGSWLS
jgi:hypothetical protein